MYIDINGTCEGVFDLMLDVDQSSSKCKYTPSDIKFIIDQWDHTLFTRKKVVSGEREVILTILTA